MHDKTRHFMSRLRERAARREEETRRRLEAITAARPADDGAAKPSGKRSPSWIDASRADEHVGQRKSSILGLLRGDVKTESTANRNLKS